MTVTDRVVTVRTPTREIDCYLALPATGTGRRPAIVVIHEIFGVDDHIRDVARRFAAQGYVAAAPNLFTGEIQTLLTPANIRLAMEAFSQAPPDLRRDPTKLAAFAASQPPERRPVLLAFGKVSNPTVQAAFAEDLLAVARFLRTLSEVDGSRVGSVGFCFGGAMSARLATVDPDLRAAVIFYGQNPPLAEVPRVRAAVLGIYGEEDPGITATVPQLAEAMKNSGHRFDYHVYPGAKHAFFNDTRASNYHAASAQDAWKRVLAFFAESLGAPGSPRG
ncbi:MAG: dienelactone hydrolase family protein [Thermoplasmata archaeon]|jgi:carboxymethylenebutenolidase